GSREKGFWDSLRNRPEGAVQQIPPELSFCFPLPLPCPGIRPDIKQNCGSSLAQAAGYVV
ncbi:MAG: hypothetical protein FWC36_00095, partial [Spirochaetes bacterium]|nr:hypothetical protein [Spirochaetota bacterium]